MFFKKALGSGQGSNKKDSGKMYTDENQTFEDEAVNSADNASKDTDAPLTNHFYSSHVQKPHHKHQQHRRSVIQDYRDTCAMYYHERRSSSRKKQREVSEEYDIASNISGLTNESDFTVNLHGEKENRGLFSNKRNKAKNKRKGQDHSKTASFIVPSIRRLTNGRGRKSRKEEDTADLQQQRRSRSNRARSYSPDRSHVAESLILSTGSSGAMNRSTANGYPHHHQRNDAPSPPTARRSIFDARMESYLLKKKQRAKSADGRRRRRSTSSRRSTAAREPSPTRQAHPGRQYEMVLRKRSSSSKSARRKSNKLTSPEPDGTKLEDYAFRASRYQAPTTSNIDRVEPLGTRLDNGAVMHTPGTKDMYMDDMTSIPSSMDDGAGVGSISKYVQKRQAKIQDIYKDIEEQKAVDSSFKGLDAEAAELEAQLAAIPVNRGVNRTSSMNTNVTKKMENLHQKAVVSRDPSMSRERKPFADITQDKTPKPVLDTKAFDPYSSRAKARMRSRMMKHEWSKVSPSDANKENIPPRLKSPHEPPVETVAKIAKEEDISSLIADDKSDSFDWKAFANYLDKKEDGMALHRSKYRSLLNSPPKDVDAALEEIGVIEPESVNEPTRLMKRSRSTGELLKRRWSPESSEYEHKSRAEELRWRSEYIEISPRETGGFLRATCFEESKSATKPTKGGSDTKVGIEDKEFDWLDSIANGTMTINHNDSHELTVNKVRQHSEHAKVAEKTKVSSDRPRASSSKKEQIRAVTQEASKKSLLSPSGDDADDASNFDDEDLIAGMYPINEKPTSKKQLHLRTSSSNDVVRQLPFQVTPSPPKVGNVTATSFSDLAKNGESKRPFDLEVAPVSMSAGQRKKMISDYLSFRDASVTSSITKQTPITPAPKVSPDPPESKRRSISRSRSLSSKIKSKTKLSARTKYFDAYGQEHYDAVPPTLGISPRSVMPTPYEEERDYNSVSVMGGKSVRSMSSTIASKKSYTSSRRSSDEKSTTVSSTKAKNGFCFPMSKLGSLNCYNANSRGDDQNAADGYAYLPSVCASTTGGYPTSSVDLRSVKLPVMTPRTASTTAFTPHGPASSSAVTPFSSYSRHAASTITPYSVAATNNEDDWFMSPMYEAKRRVSPDQVSLRRIIL